VRSGGVSVGKSQHFNFGRANLMSPSLLKAMLEALPCHRFCSNERESILGAKFEAKKVGPVRGTYHTHHGFSQTYLGALSSYRHKPDSIHRKHEDEWWVRELLRGF